MEDSKKNARQQLGTQRHNASAQRHNVSAQRHNDYQLTSLAKNREQTMTNTAFKLNENNESRRHRRVKVVLQGALRIPGQGVEMIKTVNISEGGVSLTTLGNCSVSTGKEVQLHLEGIVSNEDSGRLETYKMQVVHAEDNILGLAFL